MIVKDNYVRKTHVGMIFASLPDSQTEAQIGINPAESYFIDGNMFLENENRSIQWTHKINTSSIKSLHITHNHFSKFIQLGDRDVNAALFIEDFLISSPSVVIRGNSYADQYAKTHSFRFLGLDITFTDGELRNVTTDYD